MMKKNKKVLFVHDGPMMTDPDLEKFYGIHYNDRLVERYSFLGKSISFLMRNKVIANKDSLRYSLIQYPEFKFIQIPNFKSIRKYKNKAQAKSIIRSAVETHDVILVRLPSAAGAIALQLAWEYNKPVLVEMVACVFDALWNYDWRGKLLAHYKMKQYQRLVKRASHVIYVTESFLQNRYPTKEKSIGCSDVILKKMEDEILQKRIDRINTKLENSPLILGTVAAIDVQYKGQMDVIKAIVKLKNQGLNIRYKIVGQGSPQKLLKFIEAQNIGELIEIVGPLPHQEIFNFLDNIDIYIQPSKQEGLPRAVVEAMSCACPVLGSNIAGIPELIEKDCLFQPGNVTQIISRLKQMNKQNMLKMANNNFLRAKDFQEHILDKKRQDFYREFIEDYGL